MKILLSGSHGFVGRALLARLLSSGHVVVPLVRTEEPGSICWDPEQGRLVRDAFEGFDAVIHLAGEPLTLSRWTSSKKRKILFSRTVGTFLLSMVLSQLLQPPKIFISASAFGFYGDRGNAILTEKDAAGSGFLPSICCEWEKATAPIAARGTRTVMTRFGLVIGPNGGILQKMRIPYQLGLGGKIGTGAQWMSWVALHDLTRAIEHILDTESLEGPVNVVSPYPVQQQEFAKTLAELLHRPSFFQIPAFFLRLLFGQAAEELLLASARVYPEKLIQSGFHFQYPSLRAALTNTRAFR